MHPAVSPFLRSSLKMTVFLFFKKPPSSGEIFQVFLGDIGKCFAK